jgi:poly(3-hydroxybutyrate) depolymerase
VDFIRKVIDNVATNYNVDPRRIVVGGYQAGGAMAYLTAFGNRELIRGVAAVDMALPRGTQVPDNDPIEPLDFYVAFAEKSPQAARVEAGLKRLEEMKMPVAVNKLDGEARPLSDEETAELARWIDALDRI